MLDEVIDLKGINGKINYDIVEITKPIIEIERVNDMVVESIWDYSWWLITYNKYGGWSSRSLDLNKFSPDQGKMWVLNFNKFKNKKERIVDFGK